MHLLHNQVALPFVVEECAHAGVLRVAGKVIADVQKVTGVLPALLRQAPDTPHILCATLGCSPVCDALIAQGKLPQAEQIRDKWECYAIAIVDNNLIILGSDKRGTEFGMFELSRFIGVSPLCYWGDAEPAHQDNVSLDALCCVSHEPSVRYRGLFINDEWPCFGSWCMSHFGGVNAQMYDHVFELLLRLKANYLWPAMWASVFAEDGPGPENERLADEYGIVVGNSHHEPCLRAGEEFQRTVRAGGAFGTDWNFVRNRDGITRFWAEGLERSGKYEHLITIGMRGEADSSMLGENASLRANIDYLKDVITTQERLIQAHAGDKSRNQPRLLALYKEVEPFFYGNSEVEGLKDWDGLRNTVCMLCEDNFGFMRSLPTPETTEALRKRGCGWGMYYHVDYHGAPVSYEWMPSTPFTKLWEQMCLAYDAGIRDVWILNTGDLKGNEVSLYQFLSLAYDYERWGSQSTDHAQRWVERFIQETFPTLSPAEQVQAQQILTDLYDLNGKRRPEALNASIYHPCAEQESSRMESMGTDLLHRSEALYATLSGVAKDAFYSMIHLPVCASVNLLHMQLFSGRNAHYAAQGRPLANVYAQRVDDAMQKDAQLCADYAAFRDGKWRGMEQEAHIGFTTWNEDGCKLPLRTTVYPWKAPRLSVSRADSEEIFDRRYGKPAEVLVDDFCDAGVTEVQLEIANAGTGSLHYQIDGGAPWLTCTPTTGDVALLQTVTLSVQRDQLTDDMQTCVLSIRADDGTVNVVVSAKRVTTSAVPAYRPVHRVVTIDAAHFVSHHDTPDAAFRVLPGYGRSGSAVKVHPSMASFPEGQDAPSVTYRFFCAQDGIQRLELWLTPTSPVLPGVPMRCMLTAPDGTTAPLLCVPNDYRAGEYSDARWSRAMLDHIRKVSTDILCHAGVNEITIAALDPNFALERLLIGPKDMPLTRAYLGPKESPIC